MSRRAEDMMRRMMGMPSRKEEKRRQRQQERQASGDSQRGQQTRRHRSPSVRAAQLMRQVAVDVDYTEIREFRSQTIIDPEPRGKHRIVLEEQVSDVEYTEIKLRK